MALPQEIEPLSRAVSQIDLNQALNVLKDSSNTPRVLLDREKSKSELPKYSADEIIQIRTGTENNPIDHVEHAYISKPDFLGAVPPPYLSYPKVPPPTPATNATVPRTTVSELSIVEEDVEEKVEEKDEEVKKKKKKSSSKKKKTPATGFEEFYADPPMTPAEHEDEKWLYGESYPFEERIQTCIQRYRARRKLDEVRGNILSKYLMLGGVESSAKAFGGGLDKETIEKCNAKEIAAIQATDYVRVNGFINTKTYDGSANWAVDWKGVAEGYFSHRMPTIFPIETQEGLKTHIAVIRNFLSYVILHQVCPEYITDVMAAKRVCDLAEKQLWAIKQLSPMMPGEFNVAASTKYGGRWKPAAPETASMWKEEDIEGLPSIARGLSMADADRIFKVGIVLSSDDDKLFKHVSKGDGTIVKSERRSFKVVSIQRATQEVIEEYSTVKDNHGETGTLKPLGSITFKPWKGPKIYEAEPTAEELAKMKDDPANYETFFLEDKILELCFVGLKVEVVVHELSYGFRFFDWVPGLYCSFYTFLEQEKMTYWKEPLPNGRPPPTEDDPDAEERRLNEEIEEASREL